MLRQPGCIRVSTTYFDSTAISASGIGGVEAHRHDRQFDLVGQSGRRWAGVGCHARERYTVRLYQNPR